MADQIMSVDIDGVVRIDVPACLEAAARIRGRQTVADRSVYDAVTRVEDRFAKARERDGVIEPLTATCGHGAGLQRSEATTFYEMLRDIEERVVRLLQEIHAAQ